MDPGEVEPGDDIDEEEDEVILRKSGGRGMGLLGVEFGAPGAISFRVLRGIVWVILGLSGSADSCFLGAERPSAAPENWSR